MTTSAKFGWASAALIILSAAAATSVMAFAILYLAGLCAGIAFDPRKD